ncbi:MAG: hypothetical protein ACRDJM_05360 [Actinomycetota bacterium]
MKRSRRFGLLLAVAATAATTLGGGARMAVADAGTRVIYVYGLSTIQTGQNGQCQYEWKKVNNNPVRDQLGIPQPSQIPPKCRDADANPGNGVQPVPCNLKRNLGSYPPPWRAPDLAQGEVAPTDVDGTGPLPPVGPNPPCVGVLTATTLGAPPQACIDMGTGLNIFCELNAPTWFYGYCGQTYGGDTSADGIGGAAILKFGTETWNITKLGFARGRGVWEFGARLVRGSNTAVARFYLAAIPNPSQPGNAAGCDGGAPILSVNFFGTITVIPDVVGNPLPPKAFRTAPLWHPCADDPMWNTTYQGVGPLTPGPAGWTPENC